MKAYLIWSFEHRQWWAPASAGYTHDIRFAGRYDLQEAITICLAANQGTKPQEAIVPLPYMED